MEDTINMALMVDTLRIIIEYKEIQFKINDIGTASVNLVNSQPIAVQ